jgi:hypothetical protein
MLVGPRLCHLAPAFSTDVCLRAQQKQVDIRSEASS